MALFTHELNYEMKPDPATVPGMAQVGEQSGAGEPRWLSPAEKEAWTGLVSLVLLLPGDLEAVLQRRAWLTLFEYLTLSHVSEAPGRRLRMGELAYLASGSPSRLSNVVGRLERRDLLRRYPDPEDGRRTMAELTDEGWERVQEAAPWHLRSVREHVLDRLDDDDVAALARLAAKLGAHLPS